MLKWTVAGAVEHPTTLQVRLERRYPDRVKAGAPVPTRSLRPEELLQNLSFFTVEMQGGRSRPCDRLVFSGVGLAARQDLPGAIDQARQWGVREVLLHAGQEDLSALSVEVLQGRVDRIVLPLQPGTAKTPGPLEGAVEVCRTAGVGITTLTVLTAESLPRLAEAMQVLARIAPAAVVLSFPFPGHGHGAPAVPKPEALLVALVPVVELVKEAGLALRISGLPGCYLGPLAQFIGRSGNRWYVDAEHQCGDALLFYPGVLRFWKEESCRFCALDSRCDGFFRDYLSQGFPPLIPVD